MQTASYPFYSTAILPPSICRRRNCLHNTSVLDSDDQSALDCTLVDDDKDSVSPSFFCHRGGGGSHKKSSTSLDGRHHNALKDASSAANNSTFESIHLGVKCYRALLNNQVTYAVTE